jgi:hypothetical protein
LFALFVGLLGLTAFSAGPAYATPTPTATADPSPAPTPTETATSDPGACHPSYKQCLPIADDLDCVDVRALEPNGVDVIGPDDYALDADGDGVGCELETTAAPEPTERPDAGPQLPVTGPGSSVLVGSLIAGAVLVTIGGIAIAVSRRRRFQA